MILLRFLLVSLLIGASTPCRALVVDSSQERYNLLQNSEIFIDTTKTVLSEDIIRHPENYDFKPVKSIGSVINFGFSDATFWVRVPLSRSPQAASEWIIEIPYVGLSEVCFYAPGKPVITSGAMAPTASRAFHHRFFAFPVTLETESQNFYFRIRSSYAVSIPLMLYSFAEFNKEQVTDTLIQALYYGGLLSLLFYNLILFLSIRDRQYLIYCLFTACTGLGIFAGNGYGHLYLWPDAVEWNQISQNTLLGFSGMLATLFTRIFLNTRSTQSRFDRFLKVLGGLYFFLSLLLIGTLYTDLISSQGVFEALFFITLLASTACLYCSVKAVNQGQSSAYYFSLAWGALALGSIIASLRVFELIPSNGFTMYALQIGSGLEILLFSFALAYRIQSERTLRENAQAESLAAKQVALDALRISEDRLEEAVVRRTEKLQHLLISEQEIHAQYVRFGAMIAHEFRNPLNIIEGQTSMLELESESGINNTQKRTGAIRSATFRLANLFDQWLQSDRLNQPGTHMELTTLEVGALIDDLVKTCRNWHPEHHFSFSLPTTAMFIQADIHLLQIAILNLIDNACKYSPQGSTITISLKKQGCSIAISVLDQGRGIDPINTRRIFDLYYRASKEDQIKGTGLGLAFVQKITELHHGSIEVKSQPNNGSSFTLWLPEAGQHSA